ncbi:hypothetical protein IAR50_004862 [Cryptococcus sp. DSM 104548]
MASSQVTSQLWPADGDHDEDIFPVNGIFERGPARSFSARAPIDEEKKAYVWSSNFVEPDSKNIYRASFTSCATATKNSKAENEDCISRANEMSTAILNSLIGSEPQWGPECRSKGTAGPLKQAEKSAYRDLVDTMPDRYGDIGLEAVDRGTMRNVILCEDTEGQETNDEEEGLEAVPVVSHNMDDEGHLVDFVAGMSLVRTADQDMTISGFLSKQPSFYHGDHIDS